MAIDMDALLALAAKMNEEKKGDFLPIDLNEGNVQAIFNRCLATEGEPVTYAQVLQKALAGKDSELIEFSEAKITENSQNISYLLGQLKGVHKRARVIPLEYGIINYNGNKWTTNASILLMLYELGMVNINLDPFVLQKDKSLATNISSIKPTLSPKDPAFPAWWEEHKSEWES